MERLSPELWGRLSPVLDLVLEAPPEERGAVLDRACGGDAALRAAAEVLVHADAAADGFLEGAAALAGDGGEPLPENALASGLRVGPYRVGRELGRGGMGVVYRAERADGQFEQELALKLIRHGLDSDEVHRRFLAERRILARLNHPHIARLLDGGVTPDGRPWYAMELVEGAPLTEWCDARRLGVPQRLALFLQVCEAVAYAHRQLIVHRDLKPSNIVVTGDGGRVKLLDFGIAKVLEEGTAGQEGDRTRAELRLLTPEYAAPEQIRGEPVTTATDVYALGAVLYELLTGARAHRFERRTPLEYERVVCHTEPEPPSAAVRRHADASAARGLDGPRLGRLLRGDLDTIALTALRKEPQRRYGSAEALADDVRRYLAGYPVRARPASRAYRGRKFVERHRAGVAAAAAAGLALLVGVLGVVVQARVAVRERTKAEAVRDFLVGIFEGADPGASPEKAVTARELLERGASRIEADRSVDAEVRADLLAVVGTVLGRLGVYARADTLLGRAIAARRESDGGGAALASVLHARADLLRDQGELESAEPVYLEALELRRRRFGPRHPEVAASLSGLASLRRRRGEILAADSLYRLVLDMWRDAKGPRHEGVAAALNDLGVVSYQRDDLVAAESLFHQALALRRELLGPRHLETMETVFNLAHVLRRREKLAEAEALLRDALAVQRELYGPVHPEVALALNALATVLQKQQRLVPAESLFRETLALRRQLLGERHPQVVTSLNNLALVLHDQGRFAAAESVFRETLARGREVYSRPHPYLAATLFGLASTLHAAGKDAEVEPALREAIGIYRETFPGGHPSMTRLLIELGKHRLESGRPGAAASALREALAQAESGAGADSSLAAEARELLAAPAVGAAERNAHGPSAR